MCLFIGPLWEHFIECENPVVYFLKFWDDDTMESITYQSNLYNHQSQKSILVLRKMCCMVLLESIW